MPLATSGIQGSSLIERRASRNNTVSIIRFETVFTRRSASDTDIVELVPEISERSADWMAVSVDRSREVKESDIAGGGAGGV